MALIVVPPAVALAVEWVAQAAATAVPESKPPPPQRFGTVLLMKDVA